MTEINYNVVVIGAGPAGLAAAIEAHKNNAKVLIIERESRLGGILKQCIHDGFGLVRFKEKLSGPEYTEIFIDEVKSLKIDYKTLTFVTKIEKTSEGIFRIHIVHRDGCDIIITRALILANGCRERTAKQVFIHGTRPAGIFTAGSAQMFTNILGQLPTKKCVILGSGDIGLIMARRLTLEGAKVVGVYEAKSIPSGLTRNIHQCLKDYDIPLYLSHTVTRVFGTDRLSAVEISKVDENMVPIKGTEQIIECDALILSVGLIPENELAESLNVELDFRTKGPLVNSQLMTNVDGVFSCGNALHVNDLVDYVSESGETAGKNAACYSEPVEREEVSLSIDKRLLYIVPQKLNLKDDNGNTVIYFRSKDEENKCNLVMSIDGKMIFEKKYQFLRPPEMERLVVDFNQYGLTSSSKVTFSIEEDKK